MVVNLWTRSLQEVDKLREAKSQWEFEYTILKNQWVFREFGIALLTIDVSEEDFEQIKIECSCYRATHFISDYWKAEEGEYYWVFVPRKGKDHPYTVMNDGVKGTSEVSIPRSRLRDLEYAIEEIMCVDHRDPLKKYF